MGNLRNIYQIVLTVVKMTYIRDIDFKEILAPVILISDLIEGMAYSASQKEIDESWLYSINIKLKENINNFLNKYNKPDKTLRKLNNDVVQIENYIKKEQFVNFKTICLLIEFLNYLTGYNFRDDNGEINEEYILLDFSYFPDFKNLIDDLNKFIDKEITIFGDESKDLIYEKEGYIKIANSAFKHLPKLLAKFHKLGYYEYLIFHKS